MHHLLIGPTPAGDLIIGDSPIYGSDTSPFHIEQLERILIDLAKHTLGSKTDVLERWVSALCRRCRVKPTGPARRRHSIGRRPDVDN